MSSDARPALTVESIEKSFGDRGEPFRAVDGVSFAVEPGQFYTLLGPSGCGKTTTLRCVAGLERPDAGRITVGEQVLSGPRTFVAPHRRDIGMVFQSYAIWPHMSVFENVAFPLRVGRERVGRADLRRRVQEALELVHLHGLEGRMATQLSGGQQQRLALARALIRRPKLLLLDEPLSNLDAKLRERMRSEVKHLQRSIGITALYVTHDQAEALSMSDRIAVMRSGRIVQEGTPWEVYHRPVTRFVADFVGLSNFIEAEVVDVDGGRLRLSSALGPVEVASRSDATRGAQVTLFIRPENVVVHRHPVEAPNLFPGQVVETSFLGEHLECRLRVGEALVFARLHPSARVRPGDRVQVELPASQLASMTGEGRFETEAEALEESST